MVEDGQYAWKISGQSAMKDNKLYIYILIEAAMVLFQPDFYTRKYCVFTSEHQSRAIFFLILL